MTDDTVSVSYGDPTAAPAATGRPAASGSALGSLRARREKLLEKLYIDLRGPRWGDADGGPAIYVRYAPCEPSKMQERVEKAQKNAKKPKDWMVRENAQMLLESCVGVYAVEGDAPDDPDVEDTRPKLSLRDGDPHGTWTRFDPDLAESLGLPENCGAQAVVRALYLTESDLMADAMRLMRFSGAALPQEQEGFTGA